VTDVVDGPTKKRRQVSRPTFVWIVVLSLLTIPHAGLAQTGEVTEEYPRSVEGRIKEGFALSPEFEGFVSELKDGFGYVVKVLPFGTTQLPTRDSTQNPNNDFLKIPRYTGNLHLRPDFYLRYRGLRFMAKPRLEAQWRQWDEGDFAGETDTEVDTFVNEWLVSANLPGGFFVSYGRENLQWGPSYLLSPSNPFFRDNGRANPYREVPGSDFARVVWVPSSGWSFSFIANVDEGRQEFISEDFSLPPVVADFIEDRLDITPREFEPTYALKVDYTTYRKYLSVIASYREHDRGHLGAFGGWTVSDGLLLYGEGSVSQGTDALYPVEVLTTPMGSALAFSPIEDDEESLEALMLVGASYTFELGPTITAEYVVNTAGYNDKEADRYLELRRRASQAFLLPDPIQSISEFRLAQALDPGLRLLRKNYLLLQYAHTQIWNVLSFILRYTVNLDDHGSQIRPMVQVDVGDHTQFFMVGAMNLGPKDTEFRSLVDYGWMIGFEFTF